MGTKDLERRIESLERDAEVYWRNAVSRGNTTYSSSAPVFTRQDVELLRSDGGTYTEYMDLADRIESTLPKAEPDATGTP